MPSEVDDNATDVTMGINENSKQPGETNYNEVHNYQHATVPDQVQFSPGGPNDHSALSTRTSGYSTGNSKSSTSVTPYKGSTKNNIITVTSSPWVKDDIYPRDGTEPRGTKTHYEG